MIDGGGPGPRRIVCSVPITLRVAGAPPPEDRLGELEEQLTAALAARLATAHGLVRARHDDSAGPVRPPGPGAEHLSVRRISMRQAVPPAPGGARAASQGRPWTEEEITGHILATFGSFGPEGSTHYGVQTSAGTFVVVGVEGGQPRLARFAFSSLRRDVRGHLAATGQELVYPVGRYVFEVTGPAPEPDAPHPHVARVTDLEGNELDPSVFTRHEPGFRLVFDVPERPLTAPATTGAGTGTVATPLVRFRCDPPWDTRPLTDPAFAGVPDADLWRLFINLCNARAMANLRLVEQYVRRELLPRFAAPGPPGPLPELVAHNVEHFQEDLRLLRALLTAFQRIWLEIQPIQQEIDRLTLRHHWSGPFLRPFGFGARHRAEIAWPTPGPPDSRDLPRLQQLHEQLRVKSEPLRAVSRGIHQLIRDDPLLTRFVTGVTAEGPEPEEAGRFPAVSSELADEPDLVRAQQTIMQVLADILDKVEKCRRRLCLDPERILDLPAVTDAVLKELGPLNPRFERVAREGIADHQRTEAWTDLGLSAPGMILLVAGGLVSLLGGPAGVAAFLAAAGTVAGAVGGGLVALRSLERAIALTQAAGATVGRGAGLASVEAAHEAQLWAAVDAALTAVDLAAAGIDVAIRLTRARRARALARLAEGAEELAESAGQSLSIGQRSYVEDLFDHAKRRGLELSEEELATLEAARGAATGFPPERAAATALAEDVVRRHIAEGQDYLVLASQFIEKGTLKGRDARAGVDVLMIRRELFTEVFGDVASQAEVRAALLHATDEQLQRLADAVRRRGRLDDLAAIEVKFSTAGAPIEEILGRRLKRLPQMSQGWFREMLQSMHRYGDAEVQRTASLLERIIGTDAGEIDRLSRIGIVIDAGGNLRATRLTDAIIDAAERSRDLWQRATQGSPAYWALQRGLLDAERSGRTARAARLRQLLEQRNAQIAIADEAVRRAKQAHEASIAARKQLERLPALLQALGDTLELPQTAGTARTVLLANQSARATLEAIDRDRQVAEAELARATEAARASSDAFRRWTETVEAEVGPVRATPEEVEALRQELQELRQRHPEWFK